MLKNIPFDSVKEIYLITDVDSCQPHDSTIIDLLQIPFSSCTRRHLVICLQTCRSALMTKFDNYLILKLYNLVKKMWFQIILQIEFRKKIYIIPREIV